MVGNVTAVTLTLHLSTNKHGHLFMNKDLLLHCCGFKAYLTTETFVIFGLESKTTTEVFPIIAK